MMLVFTYDDGEKIATVSWTPEYGFIAAGDHEILDRMTYEEREPRVSQPPSAVVSQTKTATPLPIIGIEMDDEVSVPDRCFSCNCPEAAHIPGQGCAAHSCRTFVA
jgi:hypothetical protein